MKKLRVLLVDDEIMIREGFKRLFDWEAHDCEVVGEAADGMEAMAQIDTLKPDIVIMDINIPIMNGLKVIKLARMKHPDIAFVIVSGYDDFSYAVEMLRNGVREYILKPIEREKIVSILQKLNDELENKKEEVATNQKIGFQQMRHLILSDAVSEEELVTMEKQYADHFYREPYLVCCQNVRERKVLAGGQQNYILLEAVGENDVFIEIGRAHV